MGGCDEQCFKMMGMQEESGTEIYMKYMIYMRYDDVICVRAPFY